MELPKEALVNTFKFLDYDEIVNNCRLNKKVNSICNSNEFWRIWLNERFKLNLDKDLDYKKLAKKANYILKLIKSENMVVSLDSFHYMLLRMSNRDLQDLPLYPGITGITALITAVGLEYKYDVDEINQDIIFNFEQGINIRAGSDPEWVTSAKLTDIGKRNYRKFIKTIMVNTIYIDYNGKLKVIEYNYDIADWIRMIYNGEEGFSDILLMEFSSLSYNFYLRYFT